MQEAETNLKQAAIEFIEVADAATRAARDAGQADPLDLVDVDLPDLGEFEPVIEEDELARLKDQIARERMLPEALVELVNLARQVAATLAGI
jgi:hypothetical protein